MTRPDPDVSFTDRLWCRLQFSNAAVEHPLWMNLWIGWSRIMDLHVRIALRISSEVAQ